MKSQKAKLFENSKNFVHSSKAQGLPITTIIIAALGILVLIIVGFIFSGQITKFGRVINECPGKCVRNLDSMPLPDNPHPDVVKNPTFYYQPGVGDGQESCDPESEVAFRGLTIPKNLPKVTNPAQYRCKNCCVSAI